MEVTRTSRNDIAETETGQDRAYPLREAILAVVIFLLLLAILLPIVRSQRIATNEGLAIGSLLTIAEQETVFRDKAEVDQDGDGVGEYGLLGELAGELVPRQCTARVSKPYLSQLFFTGGRNGKGYVERSGYYILLYLPVDGSGSAGTDATLGGTPKSAGKISIDPAGIDMQEQHFAVYAWPKIAGSTGTRAFFVCETGKIYATKMNRVVYSGTVMPKPSAAYRGIAFQDVPKEDRYVGNDGNKWKLIEQ